MAELAEEVRVLALEATWEIAALLQELVVQCPLIYGEDQRPLVVRGLALRAAFLNNKVMSALDDDVGTPELIRRMSEQIRGENAVSEETSTS